jgi:hypothetical protein
LSCFLVLASIPIQANPCLGIQNAHMEIQPRKIGVKASYQFIFSIEQKWEIHDQITLVWPPGTNIDPPIPTEAKAKKIRLTQIIESRTIGLIPCNACQGLPVIERQKDRSIKMVFKSHVAIDPMFPGYNPVVITVPESCGFMNPTKKGKYTYKVATRSEPDLANCEPFEIVDSRIGDPEGKPIVLVNPPECLRPASYTISFQAGTGGYLKQGLGMIKLIFPDETKISLLPSQIKPTYITVNGYPLLKPPNGIRQNLNFPVPLDIKNSGKVVIQIDTQAGLINPEEPGEYTIQVATSSDPQWTSSEPWSIAKKGSYLEIVPPKVNRVAEYSLSFIQKDTPILKEQPITINFPDDVILPDAFDPSFVLVNRIPCLSAVKTGQTVQVFVGQEIKQDQVVLIKFQLKADIRNPLKPGEVRISFKTEGLPDFQQTNPVRINLQKLEIVGIDVSPPLAYEYATYEIKVIFGDQKVPVKGDLIMVMFPFLADPIRIKVEEDLPQEYVIILFDIENPDPGEYQLEVYTTKETLPVTSDYFTIE